MRKIRGIYLESARALADILRSGALDNKSKITQDQARQMEAEFARAARAIQKSIVEEVPALITLGYGEYSKIEIQFLTDAFAGIDQGRVTTAGLQSVYSKINTRLVEITVNRIGQDGYTFVQRAGITAAQFQPAMNDLIAAGFAQGRDLAKIASDLTKYVTDGKIKTVTRWGEILEPGSKALLKRVPNRIDYRALRIARSELAMSLQEGARQNGHSNPGALDLFDWVRINSIDHGCACPALQANSPYTYDNVPGYPHPNCLRKGTKVLGGPENLPWAMRRIETFKAGDLVLTHKGRIHKVNRTMRQFHFGIMVDIITKDGRVFATQNHPFLVDGQWVEAGKITQDDELSWFSEHGFVVSKVLRINRILYFGWVYNLSVDTDQSFLASGFATHNCECQVRPRLRDGREFRDELKRWVAGESAPTTDRWYRDIYLPAQR